MRHWRVRASRPLSVPHRVLLWFHLDKELGAIKHAAEDDTFRAFAGRSSRVETMSSQRRALVAVICVLAIAGLLIAETQAFSVSARSVCHWNLAYQRPNG